MTKKATANKPTTSDKEAVTTLNEIGEIRNILFGESVKALEEKIDTLNKNFTEQLASLKKEFEQSIEQTAKELSKNTNTKLDELTDYANQRFDEAAKRASVLETELADADTRMSQFETSQQQENDGFKKELDEVNNSLLERIEADNKALSKNLDEQITSLQQQKTDRAALANLFIQFAEQLNSDDQ